MSRLFLALIFVFISLQATFQIDKAAFLQILLTHFAKPSPGFDINPFSVFLGLAIPALPAISDREAEVSDLFSCRYESTFRVSAQAADQLNTI